MGLIRWRIRFFFFLILVYQFRCRFGLTFIRNWFYWWTTAGIYCWWTTKRFCQLRVRTLCWTVIILGGQMRGGEISWGGRTTQIHKLLLRRRTIHYLQDIFSNQQALTEEPTLVRREHSAQLIVIIGADNTQIEIELTQEFQRGPLHVSIPFLSFKSAGTFKVGVDLLPAYAPVFETKTACKAPYSNEILCHAITSTVFKYTVIRHKL